MKTAALKVEEIIGMLIGGVFFYLWALAVIVASLELGNIEHVVDWAIAGLLPFFLIIGHYLIAGNVIEKNKKIEDKVSIKSNIIGFFMWWLITIMLTLTNTKISYYVVLAGGYITILIIYLHLRSKIVEPDKYKGFPANYAVLVLVLLWSLFNLLT